MPAPVVGDPCPRCITGGVFVKAVGPTGDWTCDFGSVVWAGLGTGTAAYHPPGGVASLIGKGALQLWLPAPPIRTKGSATTGISAFDNLKIDDACPVCKPSGMPGSPKVVCIKRTPSCYEWECYTAYVVTQRPHRSKVHKASELVVNGTFHIPSDRYPHKSPRCHSPAYINGMNQTEHPGGKFECPST